MHRQVSRPRQDPAEEPICEDLDTYRSKTAKVAGESNVMDSKEIGANNVYQPTEVPPSHSMETVDLLEDEDSGQVEESSEASIEAIEESSPSVVTDDPEQPAACKKAIKNMGLAKGSLRSMITAHLVPKMMSEPRRSATVLPDDAETCRSPDEEIMVSCTPAMIDLLEGPDHTPNVAHTLEVEGASLTKVLKKLKSSDSAMALKLGEELARSKIQARRRKPAKASEVSGDASILNTIRRNYAESQYQRLIEGDVAGCVNALKVRTADRYRDQTLLELKLSYSAGFSAVIVFAASFLVGYYFAMYVLGIKTVGMQILFGCISAVIGGLLEAVLLMLAYGRLDANRAALKAK